MMARVKRGITHIFSSKSRGFQRGAFKGRDLLGDVSVAFDAANFCSTFDFGKYKGIGIGYVLAIVSRTPTTTRNL